VDRSLHRGEHLVTIETAFPSVLNVCGHPYRLQIRS
jgi:hypothetical protein